MNTRNESRSSPPSDAQKNIDDSGPAFPSHGSMGEVVHPGMDLRDYFAAKAMQGMLSCQDFMNDVIAMKCGSREEAREQIAFWAAAQADALIAQLKRVKP